MVIELHAAAGAVAGAAPAIAATVLALRGAGRWSRGPAAGFRAPAESPSRCAYFAGGALIVPRARALRVRGPWRWPVPRGGSAAWLGHPGAGLRDARRLRRRLPRTRPNPGSALSPGPATCHTASTSTMAGAKQLAEAGDAKHRPWLMLALSAAITWWCAWMSYRWSSARAERLKAPLHGSGCRRLAAGNRSRRNERRSRRRAGATTAFCSAPPSSCSRPWPLWW